MKTLRKLFHNLRTNPQHVIFGIFLITNGALLMSRDDYFFWPPVPWFLRWVNDDAVGFFGVMVGIALILYAMRTDPDPIVNAILLACTSGYIFLLSVFELVHAVFARSYGMGVTFTAVFCLLLLVLALARQSDAKK